MIETNTKRAFNKILGDPTRLLNGYVDIIVFSPIERAGWLGQVVHLDGKHFSREELMNDLHSLFEVGDKLQQAKPLLQKVEIYNLECSSMLKHFKSKYEDFLLFNALLNRIELCENYMEALKQLVAAQNYIVLAFEKTSFMDQVESLHLGMVKLSELIEVYFLYFTPQLVEFIKATAKAILADSSFQPNSSNQSELIFSHLISLKNVARAILWQLEETQFKASSKNWAERIKNIREHKYAEELDRMSYEKLIEKWSKEYSEEEMEEAVQVLKEAGF